MNAKERLRAYLEQRRELGESELVLDALDVDDVMRMLGALQGGGAAAAPPGSGAPPSLVAVRHRYRRAISRRQHRPTNDREMNRQPELRRHCRKTGAK